MNQVKLTGLATLLFISLFAYGQATEKSNPNGWNTIDEPGYVIDYPDSFELNTSREMNMSFMLLSKQTSTQDKFRENINLLIQDLTGHNIDLDKFVKMSEEQIKSMITNGKIITSKRIKTDSSKFQRVVYTGVQGNFIFKFAQDYWVVKDKAFILTLTCELSQFDKYKEVGEQIMNSFKVK